MATEQTFRESGRIDAPSQTKTSNTEIREMDLAESHLASTAGAESLTDEVLLERFRSQREEAAFAVLVRRHGSLVLSVCRRLLQHEQDAEDAFQAVFCVLARKAGSIRKGSAVGAWLHAVAHRIARKVRDERGRRPMPAPDLPNIPAAEESPEWVWRELRPILDEEVNRLPEKYRQAFVLCYLEGRTNEQAAVQLGCPLGTVLSRLARARDRLRSRLKRRGLALSVTALATGTLAAILRSEVSAAVVRPELTQAALQAAIASTGGRTAAGSPSSSVFTLTEGFLRSRSRSRRIRVATALLAVFLIGVVLLLLLRRPAVVPAPPLQTDEQLLQGTWRVSQVMIRGAALPPIAIAQLRMIFAGDQCTLAAGAAQFISGSFQLDSNRTPKEITVRSEQGAVWPGIYQLEGNSLKLCLNQDGPERPTTFTSPDGSGIFLYVLEREPEVSTAGDPGLDQRP